MSNICVSLREKTAVKLTYCKKQILGSTVNWSCTQSTSIKHVLTEELMGAMMTIKHTAGMPPASMFLPRITAVVHLHFTSLDVSKITSCNFLGLNVHWIYSIFHPEFFSPWASDDHYWIVNLSHNSSCPLQFITLQ